MSFSVYLAKSRGTCAGVNRAIATVELALEKYGAHKVYVLHEVVHNKHVVEDLKLKGAIFVEDLDAVPNGSVIIFSAHGVGQDTFFKAEQKQLQIIDATCPVVTGIHIKMNRASKEQKDAVVIGHKGHQEVLGTVGQYLGDPKKVHVIITKEDVVSLAIDGNNSFFATQTTLSVDETAQVIKELRAKYPNIQGPKEDDTCRATQVRQDAIKQLAKISDVVLIAGSKNSSNSNRLKEVADANGAKAYLVDDSGDIDLKWLSDVSKVGVSAGASAPEYIVKEIIEFLQKNGATVIVEVGSDLKEKSFPLPKEVRP